MINDLHHSRLLPSIASQSLSSTTELSSASLPKMTDAHRTERAGSFASSSTETATLHELTKLDPMEDNMQNLKSQNDEELGTQEDEKLLPKTNEKEEPPKASFRSAVVWMVVNTLATIGIVSSAYGLWCQSLPVI